MYGNDETSLHRKLSCQEELLWSSPRALKLHWRIVSAASIDYCKKVIFNLKNSAHVLHQKSCRRSKKSESHWKWHESVNLELSSLEGEIFATKACQSLTKGFSRALDWIE